MFLGTSVFAAPITYFAVLTGPNEAPPNASPAIGYTTVIFDSVAHTMAVNVSFAGLLAGNTAAHIHCCITIPNGTAGVATSVPTFTGFPTGATAGTYSNTFDTSLASSWNPAYIAANGGTPLSAEAALAIGLAAGTSYLNIHSSVFPGGEIRGFLAVVPEPTTLGLAGLVLAGMLLVRRRRLV
jgi:hypothetical protein